MVTDGQNAQEHDTPSEDFVKNVKDALEHLYDLSYLQRHPLLQELDLTVQHATGPAGQQLRRELAAAIEALNPGLVPFRAPHARLYNLVRLRYVERMTVREAGHELGLSLRQTHRDLRRGEESVAEVLWARRSVTSRTEPSAFHLSSFQAEMSRLATHSHPTDICALLRRAQTAVAQLALQRDVSFRTEIPPESVIISTDPVIAEQALVNVLSHAVQHSHPGILHLALTACQGQTCLSLHYFPEAEAVNLSNVSLVVAQLVDRLGWTLRYKEQPEGGRVMILHMVTRGPTVLVIDDNQGLVELLERYLTDQACRVIPATDGYEGLRLAEEAPPDAIVLDVMMPGIQGWELLQRLRNQPETAAVPIIVCSVINNPELAYSLGASLFLPKPVSRQQVLDALRQLNVV